MVPSSDRSTSANRPNPRKLARPKGLTPLGSASWRSFGKMWTSIKKIGPETLFVVPG